jgi:hypothetical protein
MVPVIFRALDANRDIPDHARIVLHLNSRLAGFRLRRYHSAAIVSNSDQ